MNTHSFCLRRMVFALCLGAAFWRTATLAAGEAPAGSYPVVEISFQLPEVSSDFFSTEIWAHVLSAHGKSVRLPAFYDGSGIWRARFTPTTSGRHSVRITQGPAVLEMAARAENISPAEFDVSGEDSNRSPGFVRRDPKKTQRFIFDNGEPYFPVGHNVAWSKGKSIEIVPIFEKMGLNGENWARVWMSHWDGKNLDWVQGRQNTPGELSLEVARKWDEILSSAETNGLRIQMVLQHHGQYSTTVNPNWKENPWNIVRGGFLKRATDFFTDPKAIKLTKQKYRYIVARWGYSTSILAWELFNEVEYTDSYEQKQIADVLKWHSDMAAYIRSIDPYDHLITTSSLPTDHPIWKTMDYDQPHIYPADLIAAAGGFDANPSTLPKPVFYGEIGPKENVQEDEGCQLRQILWPSLFAGGAGTAQYWPWDTVERKDLYKFLKALTSFVKVSKFSSRELTPNTPVIETATRSNLQFGPGGGWGMARQTEFTIPSDGRPIDGLASLSPYLHGDPKKIADRFPRSTVLRVDAPWPTTFTVRIGTIAKSGATLNLLVDGSLVASHEWESAENDYEAKAEFAAEIPAGRHTIAIRSVGKDWFYVRSFTLSNYAPALGVFGRTSPEFAAWWIYRREGIDHPGTPPIEDGRIRLSGLRPGNFRVIWWDTTQGQPLKEQTIAVARGPVVIDVPPVSTDLAAYVVLDE